MAKRQPKQRGSHAASGAAPAPAIAEAQDLAWTGQHEQALAVAAAALADTALRLASTDRLALHGLRVESLVAAGQLAEAEAEATAMESRAANDGSDAAKSRALCAQ